MSPGSSSSQSGARYTVVAATSILALVPFLVVSTAEALFRRQLVMALGTSETTVAVVSGLALAGYAFGAMLAGDLAQRFRQRRLFLICETAFVIGCALAASANSVTTYGAGVIVQGFTTGLLLIVALPPVIRGFPAWFLPISAAAIDLGFFGAATAGPPLGGIIAAASAWRWMYAVLGGVGVIVAASAFFTLKEAPPPNPSLKVDVAALVLALLATVLPFLGANELTSREFGSPAVWLPMGIGLSCFVALLLTEYHRDEPLSPVEPMWTTLPVAGVVAAMIGGGAFVAFTTLFEQFGLEVARQTPLATGLALWPTIAGAVVSSGAVGLAIRTRWLAPLTCVGLLSLIAGGWLLVGVIGRGGSPALAAFVLGIGAGASVAPGLWLASLSLQSKMVGRTFAIVELVRAEADFILAPVMVKIAHLASGGGQALTAEGIASAISMMVAITAVFTAAGVLLYVIGGQRLETPDLAGWLQRDRTAFTSPPLAAVFRSRSRIGA